MKRIMGTNCSAGMNYTIYLYILTCRIVEGLFDDLKPLATLDPLFLSAFVFVCPKPELPLLFLKIPSCFSIAWLARLVKDLGWFKKSEVRVNVGALMLNLK